MYIPSGFAIGLGVFFAGVTRAQYTLHTLYDTSNFFEAFEFFSDPDPTNGFVEYVDSATANAEGLAGFVGNAIFMGADSVTQQPANGRRSVRVTSREAFTHGLFIADIAHMPSNVCGAWPAYWMFGPDWPGSGEIDILEGVNTQASNSITLHTSEGCRISNEGSAETTSLKNSDCAAGKSFLGCGQQSNNTHDYGDGFNAVGGGVYVTEWQSESIAVWFFPRSAIPRDIVDGAPDPDAWGAPVAKFNGGAGCSLDSYFKNNNIVFTTTFCGDWAGKVWDSDAECSALAPSCTEYVAANPGDFAEAYWLVNSIKVYELARLTTTSLVIHPLSSLLLTRTPYPPALDPAKVQQYLTMASLIGLDITRNVSYFTVPAAFALAMAPHVYGVMLGGRKNFSNSKPRTHAERVSADPSLDSAVSSHHQPPAFVFSVSSLLIPPAFLQTKARVGRAHDASTNSFETLGYFAAGVLAANQAGVAPPEINSLAIGYLISRVAYIIAYVHLSATEQGSSVRSLIWMFGIGASSMLYIKAGLQSMNNTLF
ncbi:Endo-1,3(4)-beta-glucanase [Paramyrothecium foliicola]|nr:Endo-1,3(4)-beta-glucanase [Paramyrothecium foliicola]